jgi:hypothetical protein
MGLSPVALYSAAYDDLSNHINGSSSYRSFTSQYMLDSIIRKWIPDQTDAADATALAAFTRANGRCKDWRFDPSWLIEDQIINQMVSILDSFFHPSGDFLVSSYFDLLRSGRPGPGASVGSQGTSYYTKYFASTLAATSSYLYEEYRRYSTWIPSFSDAECLRYEQYGAPTIVSGSRCSFVPKTAKSSRMICVEPSLNMFYQLGLASILEDRLSSFFGINLDVQPSINHRMARAGSIDGSYATIDLSSASDSISIRLCEMLFPKWFFELLLTLRSRTTEIDGKQVPLFMISTMGNGFTFPLQTIIFSSIVMACNINLGVDALDFSVFGDDIICRKETFRLVTQILRLLNFETNPDKTFFEGPFRESCGADWLNGQPVRPVFVRKLDSPFDIMVTINQLNIWSSYTGIPVRNTCEFLINSLGRKFRYFVPFEANMDSGIRVPLSYISKKRYDSNNSFLYRGWSRRGASYSIGEEGIRSPSGLKRSWYNPPGLYCSFLFGELVSVGYRLGCKPSIVPLKIMTRHRLKSYRSRLLCTPRWDYIPSGSSANGAELSWQQWETAVRQNLNPP